jgi:hypothetical protein
MCGDTGAPTDSANAGGHTVCDEESSSTRLYTHGCVARRATVAIAEIVDFDKRRHPFALSGNLRDCRTKANEGRCANATQLAPRNSDDGAGPSVDSRAASLLAKVGLETSGDSACPSRDFRESRRQPPTHRSAMPFCQGGWILVCLGFSPVALRKAKKTRTTARRATINRSTNLTL